MMRSASLPVEAHIEANEINGDLRLSLAQQCRYKWRAWLAFLHHLSVKDVSCPVQMDTSFIRDRIKLSGGGGSLASPQRIQFRWLAQYLRDHTRGKLMRILDAGCGNGGYSHVFSETSSGSTYLGIDAATNEKWPQFSMSEVPRVDFAAMDIEDVDSLRQEFDLVISFSALEHFPDIQSVAKKLFAVQAVGGECFHAVPSHWSYFHYGRHGIRRFSSGVLQGLFEGAGYRVVRIYRLGGPFTFLLYWATRIIAVRYLHLKNVGDRVYQSCIWRAFDLDQTISWPALTYVLHARKEDSGE